MVVRYLLTTISGCVGPAPSPTLPDKSSSDMLALLCSANCAVLGDNFWSSGHRDGPRLIPAFVHLSTFSEPQNLNLSYLLLVFVQIFLSFLIESSSTKYPDESRHFLLFSYNICRYTRVCHICVEKSRASAIIQNRLSVQPQSTIGFIARAGVYSY